MGGELKLYKPYIIGVSLTILSIFIFYIDFEYVDISLFFATRKFNSWPWFSGSCILTAFTLLIPYASHYHANGSKDKFKEGNAIYGVLLIWIPLLIMYPGTETLGIVSDGAGKSAMLFILISQNIALHLAAKSIWSSRHE